MTHPFVQRALDAIKKYDRNPTRENAMICMYWGERCDPAAILIDQPKANWLALADEFIEISRQAKLRMVMGLGLNSPRDRPSDYEQWVERYNHSLREQHHAQEDARQARTRYWEP